jgi:hypothetical protein
MPKYALKHFSTQTFYKNLFKRSENKVLEGQGVGVLDGVSREVRKGSLVHIPPGVVHGAEGRMRVLVIGIPNISDDDLFFPGDLEQVERTATYQSRS